MAAVDVRDAEGSRTDVGTIGRVQAAEVPGEGIVSEVLESGSSKGGEQPRAAAAAPRVVTMI